MFSLSQFLLPGRRQSDPETEGIQDREGLPEFARFLDPLEIDHEAYTRPGGQGKVLLRDAHAFSGVAYEIADLSCGLFQACL